MRKRRNVFIILLLAVLTIFGSIECAYAKEHSGKVVADAKYKRGKNTYLCSWHGYINESVQTSGYTDSSLYSRLHIPSAGMYVSKTGRNAKTGNKTAVEFKDKKYVTYRFTIKPTTEKGAVDGKSIIQKEMAQEIMHFPNQNKMHISERNSQEVQEQREISILKKGRGMRKNP